MTSIAPTNIPIAMAQMRQVRLRKATKSANCDSALFGPAILTGEYRAAAADGSFFGASGASMGAGASAAGSASEGVCDAPEDTGSWSFVSSISLPPSGLYCHHRALGRLLHRFLDFLAIR